MRSKDGGYDSGGRLAAVLGRLADLHPKRIDLGLDRIYQLLGKLGDPHLRLPPTIHIAGTNGKGSVLAFLRAMLEADGQRVHAYTSPHLVRFNERIRLGGRLIDDVALAHVLTEVEAANGGATITFFEITTAAAMLAFGRNPADYLLLEVGLGGRMDATNVIPAPLVACITPIAHDHEHFLGSDIAGIAKEKAGIIKSGSQVISAHQVPEVAAIIQEKAATMAAPLRMLDREASNEKPLPSPSLKGQHQLDNARLAAAVLLAVKPDISTAALRQGATSASWPGRLQHLTEGRLRTMAHQHPLWLDAAHNGHGAKALATALPDLHPDQGGKWVLVAGMLNTRPVADFLTPLIPHISTMLCLTIPNQPASVKASELAATARGLGIEAREAKDIQHALTLAHAQASTPTTPILIGGSVYLAGLVLAENRILPD